MSEDLHIIDSFQHSISSINESDQKMKENEQENTTNNNNNDNNNDNKSETALESEPEIGQKQTDLIEKENLLNSENPSLATDSTSLGSTISHFIPIVSTLSTGNATTLPTHTTVIASTAHSTNTSDNTNSSILSAHELDDVDEELNKSINTGNKFHPTPVASIQSQPGVNFTPTDELRASFTGISNQNTDPISMVLPDSNQSNKDNDDQLGSSNNTNSSAGVIGGIGVALGIFNDKTTTPSEFSKNQDKEKKLLNNPILKTSPLLSSTPPTVSKSLIKLYPFLILVLKLLNILTWNSDSIHLSIFLVLLSSFSILYYEPLIIYLGHLFPVFLLWIYTECKSYIKIQQVEHSTLDDIIQTMTLVAQRSEILISPVVELDLTAGDLKRLLFTTVFLSPVYVTISFFILPPNKMLLAFTILILTYHSKWSKITRVLLWKSRSFRLLCFYLTGLDFENSGLAKTSTLFNLNRTLSKRFRKNSSSTSNDDNSDSYSKSSVRFTYVIYENQRRWLGVGWTPNLLSYERTPWTDEFLNESEPIESFELPQLPLSIDIQDSDVKDFDNKIANNGGTDIQDGIMNSKGMVWRWIDKTWRLDLTNDGAIQLPSTRPKTTANPRSDDGWIYYDNTWKNPTTEDGFSKYTRRRRWIRTAELVYVGNIGGSNSPSTGTNSSTNNSNNTIKKGDVSVKDSNTVNAAGKSVRIVDDVNENKKVARFSSSESVLLDADSSDNEVINDGKKDRKWKFVKGSIKKKEEPESGMKKRKVLRFEEPVLDESETN